MLIIEKIIDISDCDCDTAILLKNNNLSISSAIQNGSNIYMEFFKNAVPKYNNDIYYFGISAVPVLTAKIFYSFHEVILERISIINRNDYFSVRFKVDRTIFVDFYTLCVYLSNFSREAYFNNKKFLKILIKNIEFIKYINILG